MIQSVISAIGAGAGIEAAEAVCAPFAPTQCPGFQGAVFVKRNHIWSVAGVVIFIQRDRLWLFVVLIEIALLVIPVCWLRVWLLIATISV